MRNLVRHKAVLALAFLLGACSQGESVTVNNTTGDVIPDRGESSTCGDSILYVCEPRSVDGLTTGVTEVDLGVYHLCAVKDSAASCVGLNQYGQLGNNTNADSLSLVTPEGLTANVTDVGTGYFHSCAVVSGAVKCWGKNESGQLGNGTTTDATSPVDAGSLTGVTAVVAGASHSCALEAGGVKCWGRNHLGQLGNGTTTDSSAPVQVTGLTTGVTALSSGAYHTCALVSGGVKCWGFNSWGQVGDGTTTNATSPADVTGHTSGVDSVAAGAYHTCLVSSGTVKCFGWNDFLQLASPTTTTAINSTAVLDVDLSSISSFTPASVDAGFGHTCALSTDNNVACWGMAFLGEVGDSSSITDTSTPFSLSSNITAVDTIIAAGQHSCGIKSGALLCWGSNLGGELKTTSSSVTVSKSMGVAGQKGIVRDQLQ